VVQPAWPPDIHSRYKTFLRCRAGVLGLRTASERCIHDVGAHPDPADCSLAANMSGNVAKMAAAMVLF